VYENWPQAGCGNWDLIKLADATVVHSREACKQHCSSNTECYAANYQTEDCPDPMLGDQKGACYAYSKGSDGAGCQQGFNGCWELYIKSP